MAQMLMAAAGGEGTEAEASAAEASQRLQEMLEQHSEEGELAVQGSQATLSGIHCSPI